MTFERLYNLIFENLRSNEVFKKQKRLSRQIPTVSNTPIQTSEELVNRIRVLLAKGSILDTTKLTSDEVWSTMLFRGHKTLDPFSKTGDSKAVGDKVYWAKNPSNALIYSLFKSSWGTSGQQYINVIQRALAETGDAGFNDGTQTNFQFGYLTIAQPKNPEALKWYVNFGVENEERERQEAIRDARQKHMEQNPNKLFTGLSKNIKNRGYTPDELRKEHQRQIELNKRNEETAKANVDAGKSASWVLDKYKNFEPNVFNRQAETVLSKNDVQKIRTYLIWSSSQYKYYILPIETIKKYDPMLYRVLAFDRI
jgi:hypothetical protein